MVQPASFGQTPLHTSPRLSLGQHRLAGSSSSHLLKIDSSKDSSSSKHYHHGGKQQQDQQEGQDLVLERVLVAKVVVAVPLLLLLGVEVEVGPVPRVLAHLLLVEGRVIRAQLPRSHELRSYRWTETGTGRVRWNLGKCHLHHVS